MSGLLKCPSCICCFCNPLDLRIHLQTHWRKAKNGNGEIMSAKLNPVLAARISVVGTLIEGGYRYALLGTGRTLWRKKENVKY